MLLMLLLVDWLLGMHLEYRLNVFVGACVVVRGMGWGAVVTCWDCCWDCWNGREEVEEELRHIRVLRDRGWISESAAELD